MGDGRYYSPEQFFSVMFLTIFMIFMATRTVLIYYKGSGLKLNKWVIVLNSILGTMVMVSIFERVLVSQKTAFLARLSIGLLFVTFNFLCLFILISYYEGLIQKSLHIKLALLLVWSSTMIVSIYHSKILIHTYDFHKVVYGLGYLWILLGTFFAILSYLFKSWRYLKDHNKNIPNLKLILFTMVIGWLLPMIFYLYSGFSSSNDIVLIEYIILFFLGLGLSLLFELTTPYRVSTSIFNDVKKYMLDYVFIVDEKGQIIYKNTSAANSHFFKKLAVIDVDNLQALFEKTIKLFNAYSKDIIAYDEQASYYLSYSITALTNDQELGGYILTFTDITSLITLLDELKDKQSETVRINSELEAYKDIVYDLEEEKEISALLSEIASNQQKSMEQLKIDIRLLMENNQEDFEEAIESLIVKAKDDLRSVRESVTTYRAYYGGEHD